MGWATLPSPRRGSRSPVPGHIPSAISPSSHSSQNQLWPLFFPSRSPHTSNSRMCPRKVGRGHPLPHPKPGSQYSTGVRRAGRTEKMGEGVLQPGSAQSSVAPKTYSFPTQHRYALPALTSSPSLPPHTRCGPSR